jgi:sugar fermentation stimulation protein A
VAEDHAYPTPLLEATLVRRYKRFLADVALPSGRVLTAHCANPGSMKGLAEPGRPVRIRDSGDPKRKLRHSLEQVRPGRAWVCVNTALANRVVQGALRRGGLPPFRGYPAIRPEATAGPGSRLDFLLEGEAGRCWIEVKSVTLREEGEARFPDAVTARGLKHLEHLAALRTAGDRAAMLFVVPRADVTKFRPAWAIDPAYAEGLVRAHEAGVEIHVLAARVSRRGLRAARFLPYDLRHG